MFQFTHPVRGATATFRGRKTETNVSIHAPRAGCDQFKQMNEMQDKMFQFTHPVRGATIEQAQEEQRAEFQFTHPVRGATYTGVPMFSQINKFQFTHPVRGATEHGATAKLEGDVSIHAPRAGCDLLTMGLPSSSSVSIHAPRAGCDRQIL